MPEQSFNLWAPWRMEYLKSITGKELPTSCFLCDYWKSPESDEANGVVRRTDSAMVALNRYPYSNGHLLIAPASHVSALSALSVEELNELSLLIRDSVSLLERVVGAEGFNIGYNLGRCAGAGLPNHIHAHVVPRWNGDTNFMSVVSQTRVVPEEIGVLWRRLREAF